jgi:hypothetical protein
MRVPAKILQYLCRTAERRFGIDDPLDAGQLIEQWMEALPQRLQRSVELQLSGVEKMT